jgi:hypothetical protein
MKKIGFLLFSSLLLVSGIFTQRTIIVTNKLGIDRKGEIVEVNLSALKISFDSKTWVLKNNENKEVSYQLIFSGNKKPQSLIFQADVKANKSTKYTLTQGIPAEVKSKTFARFVPERKDDFAWENDLCAFRMYGPALANENPSNGVDLWVKRTNELIVDEFYNGELKNGISYHVDHGHGLDLYKVAHTLGCGGISPYTSGKLWVGNHFDHYRVIEVGPLRSVFTLIYDSVKVGELFYKEELTISTNAGCLLNKADVKFIGPVQKMELAAGIYLHNGKGVLKQIVANGTSAYAEDAISDAGVPSGRNYAGFYIPSTVDNAFKEEEHGLMTSTYKVGDSFTYYFGGGWSKWCYSTDEDWFNAISRFSEISRNPLKIIVK